MKQLKKYFLRRFKLSTLISMLICTVSLLMALSTFFFIRCASNKILISKYLVKYLTYAHQDFEINISEMIQKLHTQTMPVNLSSSITRLSDSYAENMKSISAVVAPVIENSDIIDCITVITDSGTQYPVSNGGAMPSSLGSYRPVPLNAYDIALTEQTAQSESGAHFVVFEKLLTNYSTNQNSGRMLIYVNQEKILELYKNSILNESSVFITLNNTILSHKDPAMIGKTLYIPTEPEKSKSVFSDFGKNTILNNYVMQNVPVKNLSMITVLYKDYTYRAMYKSNKISIIILVLNILFSMAIAYFLSVNLSNSLNRLSRRIQGQNLKPCPDDINADNEIYILEKRFNEFITEIDNLITQNNENAKKKQTAEFTALQAQINPHFIYNILESMSGMARVKNQPEIQKVCFELGKYFRLGLNKGSNIVSVEDELNHVKSYIALEQIRFIGKFTVEFDVDEDILKLPMLKILLQPIVENAIHHAFNKIHRMGLIKISGRADGEYIIFEVSDNGRGITVENPLQLRKPSDTHSGYGLSNVNQRIKIEYGGDCGLQFKSAADKGTTVTIKIKNKAERAEIL